MIYLTGHGRLPVARLRTRPAQSQLPRYPVTEPGKLIRLQSPRLSREGEETNRIKIELIGIPWFNFLDPFPGFLNSIPYLDSKAFEKRNRIKWDLYSSSTSNWENNKVPIFWARRCLEGEEPCPRSPREEERNNFFEFSSSFYQWVNGSRVDEKGDENKLERKERNRILIVWRILPNYSNSNKNPI